MPELIFKPSTTYGLECIRERFEVPMDAVPAQSDTPAQRAFKLLFIESCAKKTGERAIQYYEKFRHWKFRDDIPVELDESELQIDPEDYEFASPLVKNPTAVDQGHLTLKTSKYAYVVKLWFETQQIQTVVWEPDAYGHAEGFATEDEVLNAYEKEESNGN